MPFRQLKSFLKILIGVQYKKKTAATLTVRQRRHSPGIFSAADEVCTPFTQGACPLMSGSCRKHSISSFICLSSIPTNLSTCTFFRSSEPELSQKSKVPKQNNVIANQRRNAGVAIPPIFKHLRYGFYAYPGDCHTSDIGHWFAMTWYILAMLTHRGT